MKNVFSKVDRAPFYVLFSPFINIFKITYRTALIYCLCHPPPPRSQKREVTSEPHSFAFDQYCNPRGLVLRTRPTVQFWFELKRPTFIRLIRCLHSATRVLPSSILLFSGPLVDRKGYSQFGRMSAFTQDQNSPTVSSAIQLPRPEPTPISDLHLSQTMNSYENVLYSYLLPPPPHFTVPNLKKSDNF